MRGVGGSLSVRVYIVLHSRVIISQWKLHKYAHRHTHCFTLISSRLLISLILTFECTKIFKLEVWCYGSWIFRTQPAIWKGFRFPSFSSIHLSKTTHFSCLSFFCQHLSTEKSHFRISLLHVSVSCAYSCFFKLEGLVLLITKWPDHRLVLQITESYLWRFLPLQQYTTTNSVTDLTENLFMVRSVSLFCSSGELTFMYVFCA